MENLLFFYIFIAYSNNFIELIEKNTRKLKELF
jgi:hypothetical protein